MLVFNFDTTFIHSIFYCLQRLVTQTGFLLLEGLELPFKDLIFLGNWIFPKPIFPPCLFGDTDLSHTGWLPSQNLTSLKTFSSGRANWGHNTLGHRELGPLGTWATENLGYCELWPLGPLGTWSTGNLGHLELGPLETWATRSLGHLDLGPLGTWATLNLGHLELGPPWTRATWNLAFSKLLPTSMLPKDLLRQRWEYCTGRPFFD